MSNQCPLCQSIIPDSHSIDHAESHFRESMEKHRLKNSIEAMTTGAHPAKAVKDLAFTLVDKGFITADEMYRTVGVDLRESKPRRSLKFHEIWD